MKALAAILVVALLSYSGPAQGQDGSHGHSPDPRIEELAAENDAQAAAIERNAAASAENAAGLAERADIDRAIGQDVIDIKAAVDALRADVEALKSGEPQPDPDPAPARPPVYSVGEAQKLTPLSSETLTTAGPFNLCLKGEDTSGPVLFSWDGGGNGESEPDYCLFGGNDAPYPLNEFPVGEHAIEITAGEAAPFTVRLVVENTAPQPPPPDTDPNTGEALLQVGPWNPATFNIEEPYIDIIHVGTTMWTSGNFDQREVIEGGYINAETGLPVSLPDGETLTSEVYFTTPRNSGLGPHWDGPWVLDWQTEDGACNADLELLYFPSSEITAKKPCRIEFTRNNADGITPYHMAIQIKRLDSPLVSLRMYRAENETLLNAGRIYNPRFVEAIGGYDIVRMMDLQLAGRAEAVSSDEMATMNAAHWSNKRWQAPKTADKVPVALPYLGTPLEAVFALGVEADVALWVHAPITLGSPVDIYDPAIYDANAGTWLNNISAAVRAKREAILASDQWDLYANRFVAALETSGYPETRTLYVTVANEVWNYAGQYNYTTRYATALGDNMRDGYGKALARFKLALDAALARAGRDQNILYVNESQAANADLTRLSLIGMQSYLEAQGEGWEHHAANIGVSVASYWGAAEKHLERDGVDPNDLAALEGWFLNGPNTSVSTLPWNLRKWRDHAAQAAKFGVKLIGAYEGGSHFERPSAMTAENYQAFVWGEPGRRINTAVNCALADAFPGAILSNYVLAGPVGGQPWFEGPLGADTPMNRSFAGFPENCRQ